MGKAWKALLLLFLLSLSLTIAHIQEKGEESAEESTTVAEEHNEFEGAFSSLDGMLQWAISHSDPTRLKEKAHDVQGLSADELMKLQLETKELVEKLKVPSDAELMQAAITDLNNSSLSLEDLHRALNDLLILVESIDNANGLNKLGGLVAVIQKLNSSEPEIRTTSAWILGKASQNNPVVQKQALMAIRNLLQLTSTKELVSNDLWGLDEAMVKMREQLEDLMEDEHRRDYAKDVESLRREVELIFHSRLDKVT